MSMQDLDNYLTTKHAAALRTASFFLGHEVSFFSGYFVVCIDDGRIDDGVQDWREEYDASRDIPVEEVSVRDAFAWLIDSLGYRINRLGRRIDEPECFDDIPF